jgi:dihydropteroate synthase
MIRSQDSNKTLNCNGKIVAIDSPLLMAIVNCTPDSFYTKSRISPDATSTLLDTAARYLDEGATFLDVGGYSTRPGAAEVSEQEETDRVVPVIEALRSHFPDALISIDTFRSKVAQYAVSAGAVLVNDVSGGNLDPEMFGTVAKLGVPYVLTHMRGTPQTMQTLTDYTSVTEEVIEELALKVDQLQQLGVADLLIDPGFGFAKTLEQNYTLLRELDRLWVFGYPVLVGVSRKTMICKALNIQPDDALNGTTALHAFALERGANILRVHDVKAAREVVELYQKLHQA